MDLFEAAKANADCLKQQYENAIAALAPPDAVKLHEFAEHVERYARQSVNMRQSELLSFVVTGKHQNMYEWAQDVCTRSSKSTGEILKDRLGPFYERRVAFDGHFDEGRRFRYGALNIGGLGLSNFGEYCLVVSDTVWAAGEDVAYLRGDSLKTYMAPGPAVDDDAIRRDVAPHTHRHYLAAVKHADDLGELPDTEWPRMLCSNAGYVEAIFTHELGPRELDAVRMPRFDYELYFMYIYEEFRDKLTDDERLLTGMFKMILDVLEEHSVPMEPIDDD